MWPEQTTDLIFGDRDGFCHSATLSDPDNPFSLPCHGSDVVTAFRQLNVLPVAEYTKNTVGLVGGQEPLTEVLQNYVQHPFCRHMPSCVAGASAWVPDPQSKAHVCSCPMCVLVFT